MHEVAATLRIRNMAQSTVDAAIAADEQLTNNCSVFSQKSTVCVGV